MGLQQLKLFDLGQTSEIVVTIKAFLFQGANLMPIGSSKLVKYLAISILGHTRLRKWLQYNETRSEIDDNVDK